jgi:hypothetical protein
MAIPASKIILNQSGTSIEYTAIVAVVEPDECVSEATKVFGKTSSIATSHPLKSEAPISAAPDHLRVEVFMCATDA